MVCQAQLENGPLNKPVLLDADGFRHIQAGVLKSDGLPAMQNP
jgi:hypothetical protein